MKIIVVGDLHIDNKKSSIKNNESFDEIFRLFNQLTEKVLDIKPEFVVFVGDIFDSPDNISTNVMSIVSMLFRDLSKLVKLIILAGNHDVVDDDIRSIDLTEGKKGYLRSSLVYPLGLNEDIYIVDTPHITHIEEIKTSISFIPYSFDIVESINSIKGDIRSGYTNIMIGHFETRDVTYVKMVKDQTLVEHLPSAEELFNIYKQKLVLLGHVHDKGIIEAENHRLVYVGSARNINYNNKDEDKGMHILDLETLDLEYVPNYNTAIYKVFRTPEELEEYVDTTDKEKLAKTKIKYIYSDSKDTLKYSQFKKNLRRLEFEKSIFSKTGSEEESQIELKNLKIDSLLEKENLFRFILDFKNIAEENREEYLKHIKSFESEEEE